MVQRLKGGIKKMARGGRRSKIPQSTKQTAVELVISGEKSAYQVSKELGLNYKSLCSWVSQYKKEHNLIQKDPEKEELKKLKKELLQLKQENEILKKAMAYFAKENL